MPNVVPFPPPQEASSADLADPRDGKVLDAIRLLLSTLPLEDQRRVIQELGREVQPITAPRAGAVLGTIIEWMPRDSAWTVEEAKQAIAMRGIEASAKEIYNAIAYLNRKGRVKRISYGHYTVDGAGIVTADDLGAGPPPMEDGEV